MKLIDIDKKRYKKHLNLVSVALVIGLSVLSLAFGALLIAAFGSNGMCSARLRLTSYSTTKGPASQSQSVETQ